MGAQLVGRAFVFATKVNLNPNEMRLLIWMSLRALDAENPPRYFDSREASALGLGRRVPEAPDIDDPDSEAVDAERAAAFQRVKIATRGLVDKGAIKRIRRGREGSRAEFALIFGERGGLA